MLETKLHLVIGALLHDIGQLICRAADNPKNRIASGESYLKETVGINNEDVLDCVKYCHGDGLGNAGLPEDALAYIVHTANKIASGMDGKEQEDPSVAMPLSPVFNILNGNNGNSVYNIERLDVEGEINFPDEPNAVSNPEAYQKILSDITASLKGFSFTESSIHSLLDILEVELSYIPSCTNCQEEADISLFNHLKLTAALAAAIMDYLVAEDKKNYRECLFENEESFYAEKAFLLATFDLSGIQKFIYTIHSDGALKNLRARSFYLDFMTEHLSTELLQKLSLTRANLLYSGGGRADFLLPNTTETKQVLRDFQEDVNKWFRKHFDIALFIALGIAEAGVNDLRDDPHGSYADILRIKAQELTDNKSRRYTAEEILSLNGTKTDDDSRECRVCKKSGLVNDDGTCALCTAMQKFSAAILEDGNDFFVAAPGEDSSFLPLPAGFCLRTGTGESARRWQDVDGARLYGKNSFFTGKNVVTRMWVGDYHTGQTFEELAEESTGIKRLGVLRADVDNLGLAFAAGFKSKTADTRNIPLFCTAELSRQLSIFFKLHLRKILGSPKFTLTGKTKELRHAATVYAGGDDLFIVGAWDDILELAVDIRHAFSRFTENTLTMSAGIGIYHHAYPISVIAEEVAALEEKSKSYPGKNAVTLPSDGDTCEITSPLGAVLIDEGTFSWDALEKSVVQEKFRTLYEFFDEEDVLDEDGRIADKDEMNMNGERGKNFLYNLLSLLRGRKEKINIARYVYLLSRMEPGKKASKAAKDKYRQFAERMFGWIQNEGDTRELKMAIMLYVYLMRERSEMDNG